MGTETGRKGFISEPYEGTFNPKHKTQHRTTNTSLHQPVANGNFCLLGARESLIRILVL